MNNFFKILCLSSAALLAVPGTSQNCVPGADSQKHCTKKCCETSIPALKGISMQTDRRVISYILPKRIMWKQSTEGSTMENEGILLKNNYGQTALGGISFCHLKNGKPCPHPEERYSCMSAYCIFVRKLAEQMTASRRGEIPQSPKELIDAAVQRMPEPNAQSVT